MATHHTIFTRALHGRLVFHFSLILVLAHLGTLAVAQGSVTHVRVLNRAHMDFTTHPGNDFVRYAGGLWLNDNPVPANETRWGSFTQLRDFNTQAVRSLLEDAARVKKAKRESAKRRLGDFYASAMDSLAIEKHGFGAIQQEYLRAGAVRNIAGVLKEVATQRTESTGNVPLFNYFVGQDPKRPQTMLAHFVQGGITMPNRDYYLKDDATSRTIRQAFHTYLIKLFTLAGESEIVAAQKADAVLRLETKLASAQLSRMELRNPSRTYNKFSIQDLNKKTLSIHWTTLLDDLFIGGEDTVLVSTPDFFLKVDTLLRTTPIADWRAYLQWNVLHNPAPLLSSKFAQANFIYSQHITGQQVQRPRWQRMGSIAEGSLRDLVGQLYVERYFKPEAKVRIDEMVKNIVKAYEVRILNLDWMSHETKQKALIKLKAIQTKIGYPEKWKNYDGVVITRHNFYQNLLNISKWHYTEMISKLGRPVDQTEFSFAVPAVNAGYSPVKNEIIFPAGALQYPFFHPDADDAFNYGAIGTGIGHEISHAFDDRGSQFDEHGMLRNWWLPEDLKKFREKARLLEIQFNGYTVLDTIPVNGKLTVGENLADLAGLQAAYDAFKMTPQGKSAVEADGFTPDQRFFLAYAQIWRMNVLPETKAQLILNDEHSPGEFRTIGPLVNMDAWYDAFGVTPDHKLYKKPEDRIRIW